MSTEAIVLRGIGEKLGIDPNSISLDAALATDFKMDSLEMIELVMALEESFSIEIPTEAAQRITTVRSVITYIDEVLAERKAAGPGVDLAVLVPSGE